MTNSLQIGKKTFTIAVAAATILWTVGFAAFVPVQAQAASFGDLIKGQTLSTVYYYGSDGQRYSFPNEKTFKSWYSDFSGVKTITDSELANITLAGNIAYRPGSRWVKITSDNKVYAVSTDGSVRWVESEAVAKGLAGDNWNQFIDDVPDVFFVDYTVGASLTSASLGYDGMLWTDGTSSYLVSDGKLRMVSSAGLSANGFSAGMTLAGTGFKKASVTAGTAVTAKLASLTDAAQMVTTDTYAATQDVTVSLAASSPSASTVLVGQGLGHMATLKFTNPTSSDVKVKKLSLQRGGVSADSTLSNVYLFDGWIRMSDSASVSSGVASWNDALGLFTIPANGSKEVFVRSDIAASTSGQTVSLSLASGSAVEFIGSYAATGSYPLTGATHTIAAAPSGSFTSVTVGSATPADANVDAQDGYTVWNATVTVATNEALLQAMRFRNIGSVNAEDVKNWKLYIDAVQAGSTVSMQDADGYITFDMSAAPVKVKTGARNFKVVADIIGGTSRTITVSLHKAADAVFVDEDFKQADVFGAGSFSTTSAGALTVNTGSLSVVKASDTPTANVVLGASNVTLGKWDMKASGEAVKLENLRFNYESDNDINELRNGAVYVDGNQIGSTASLNDNQSSGYTEYSFGSSLIVVPGTPVVIELRADIYDNDGTDNLGGDETITANMDTGSSNALRQSTGTYFNGPTGDVAAGLVTVKVGSLSIAKDTSFANQNLVTPKVAVKVGSFTVTGADTNEGVNVTSLILSLDGGSTATSSVTNAYLKYGPKDNMVTSTTKSTVALADTGNTWNINYTIPALTTIYVEAYVDVSTTFGSQDTIITNLDLTGTASDSGTAVAPSDVNGQTITAASGVFTSALDGSTPVAMNVAGGQEVVAGKYKFTAQNETYTIKSLQVKVGASAAAGGLATMAKIYDGDTLVGSGVFATTASVANDAALISGLSIPVAAGSYKVLTAKLVLNNVGAGAAYSQDSAALTMDEVKAYNSQGTLYSTAAGYTDDRAANELRVYKAIPVVNHVDLTNSTLVNGQATDLYKFTITAQGGNIAIKQLNLPFTFSDGLGSGDLTTTETLEIHSLKLYKNGTDISTGAAGIMMANGLGVTAEGGSTTGIRESDSTVALNIIWDTTEEVISAGETVTYTVRGTPYDFNADGDTGETDSVSMYLAGDSSGNTDATGIAGVCIDDAGAGDLWQLGDTASFGAACTSAETNSSGHSFIWSDISGAAHDSTGTGSPDWSNGYLVLNLDLTGETWSK